MTVKYLNGQITALTFLLSSTTKCLQSTKFLWRTALTSRHGKMLLTPLYGWVRVVGKEIENKIADILICCMTKCCTKYGLFWLTVIKYFFKLPQYCSIFPFSRRKRVPSNSVDWATGRWSWQRVMTICNPHLPQQWPNLWNIGPINENPR